MSRNEHGAYGPRYDASTHASVAGGAAAQPPHTGVEHPMASAPHAGYERTRPAAALTPPVILTLLAVLFAVPAMIWPLYRLRQPFGTEGAQELVLRFWLHGAIATEMDGVNTVEIRATGTIVFGLLMLGALGAALTAWFGRSVRSDALGLLAVAVLAGAILVPTLLAFGADLGSSNATMVHEYGAGVWTGLLSALCALAGATGFFVRLGRRTPPPVRN